MKYRLLQDTPFHRAGSIFQSEGEKEMWHGKELLKCKCDVTGLDYDFPVYNMNEWLDLLPEKKYYVSLDNHRITYYSVDYYQEGIEYKTNVFNTENDAKEAMEAVVELLRHKQEVFELRKECGEMVKGV